MKLVFSVLRIFQGLLGEVEPVVSRNIRAFTINLEGWTAVAQFLAVRLR